MWLVVQRVRQEVTMDFHVIQYRMHLAVSLLLKVDWEHAKWCPEGPLVGKLKGR